MGKGRWGNEPQNSGYVLFLGLCGSYLYIWSNLLK